MSKQRLEESLGDTTGQYQVYALSKPSLYDFFSCPPYFSVPLIQQGHKKNDKLNREKYLKQLKKNFSHVEINS